MDLSILALLKYMKSILSPIRNEEGRRLRRIYGDKGASFRNKTHTPRIDGISNTITSVQKDNHLLEIYKI